MAASRRPALQRQAEALLRARKSRNWSQQRLISELKQVARSLHKTKDLPSESTLAVYVSNSENGRRPIPERLRIFYREAFQATDEDLGFSSPTGPLVVADTTTPVPPDLPAHAGLTIVTGLRDVLSAHVQADSLLGPRYIIPAVHGHLPLIERVCQITTGPDHQEALRFGNKFLEFSGWLYQDSGDYHTAMSLTNRALDYALELGDRYLIAYTLMRRSNIATDAGEPGQALGLAKAALANSIDLTPRLKAVILRQQANSYAMLGSGYRREFEEATDGALAAAIDGMDREHEYGGHEDRAAYCTPAYVEMEAGASWVRLGEPLQAIPIFEESRAGWQEGGQMRDRTLCLARLATAYATADDPAAACDLAQGFLTSAEGIGSMRVNKELRRLAGRLRKWPADSTVADLLSQLNSAVNTAQTYPGGHR